MPRTFQEHLSEQLQSAGFSLDSSEIPERTTVESVLTGLLDWWDSVDAKTKAVITPADLSEGLWNEGFLTHWQALYTLAYGNRMGDFASTMNTVKDCVVRAGDGLDAETQQETSGEHSTTS